MKSKLLAGLVAGLLGGMLFGMMMQMMKTPDGKMPMMGMVALVVGSKSLLVGWLYHLFNSAVVDALFGWLLGSRVHGYGSGLGSPVRPRLVGLGRPDPDARHARYAGLRTAH